MKAAAFLLVISYVTFGLICQPGSGTMCYGPSELNYTREELFSISACCSKKDYRLDSGIYNVIKTNKIAIRAPTRRGTRGGINTRRNISVLINAHDRGVSSTTEKPTGPNLANLITIRPQTISTPPTSIPTGKLFDFCVLNTRSVGNKAKKVKRYVIDHKLDSLALTETWLNPGNKDAATIGDLCPEGYELLHKPRVKRGGGVGLLRNDAINVKPKTSGSFKSFEHSEYMLTSDSRCIRIIVLYRPPPSPTNGLTHRMFMEDFAMFLEQQTLTTGQLLIVGDFNYHVEDGTDREARQFIDMVSSFNLVQHVTGPTHKHGHTLDLVITRKGEDTVSHLKVFPHGEIADHGAIHMKLHITKPGPCRKEIVYRKLRSIDKEQFKEDISCSNLVNHPCQTIESLVDQYDSELQKILDVHAPMKKQIITIRPNTEWYSDGIREEKRVRRKLERHWRFSLLEIDRQIYVDQCRKVDSMCEKETSDHYRNIIHENASDQKQLFKITNKLMHRNDVQKLPSHDSTEELADRFADYFIDKIMTIRSNLAHVDHRQLPAEEPCNFVFSKFSTVSEDEVRKLIVKSPTKSCNLDSIPTWLLKDCLDTLLPVITKIVNLSLSSSVMPDKLKEAILSPRLKKALMDSEILKHFRPVSNLTFVSKLIERVVAGQMNTYMRTNDLNEKMQSAYKTLHSTETALIRVHNDILCAIDGRKAVVLVLLDLSAAFDTVDHALLLNRLSCRFGIQGQVLAWFKSYLTNRKQSVCIQGVCSSSRELTCGVPQGSVLGPILFTAYMSPLGDIIKRHGLQYHLYADDSQLYLAFNPTTADADRARECMEHCIHDIKTWMTLNYLKLNEDKTEVLVIGSRYHKKPPFSPLLIGQEEITGSTSARNLGVIFDTQMTQRTHVNAITSSLFDQIRSLGMIRKYLEQNTTEILVHAFITSRLDYCNSLLYGLPWRYCMEKLQNAQNTAARLVLRKRKFDHISEDLEDLHWLPVQSRVVYKILLTTYKALNGLAPEYISELVQIHEPPRSLRSAAKYELCVRKPNLKTYGARSFSFAAPVLWNEMPLSIRQSPSIDTFKSHLKTYLWNMCY